MKFPFVTRSRMEREVSEAARDNLLMVRLIDLDKKLDLLHSKIGAPADALTVSAFRAAMVEVHESDSAFKEALCAQVHDTIDPFSNYTSALNRIFGELEQIRKNQAGMSVAIAGAVMNVVETRFGSAGKRIHPEREPRGIIAMVKKAPPKRSSNGMFKGKKKNA